MRTIHVDTQEAPCKWAAYKDAERRNQENASRHTDKNKIQAERMKYALELLYSAKHVYIAYGKTGISIKLTKPAVVRNRKDLGLMEEEWTAKGFIQKDTDHGITYWLKT